MHIVHPLQVLAVLGIFFGVLFYRIAIAGLLYNALIGVSGGPSIANIVVSITGAAIQLIFIIFLNNIYGYLALVLNNWGKWCCETERMVGEMEGYSHRVYFSCFIVLMNIPFSTPDVTSCSIINRHCWIVLIFT